MRRLAVLAALPVLLAASAPVPPAGFVGAVNGIPRGLDGALEDVHAAGFGAVRLFLRWDKIEAVEGAPDWTCRYLTTADVGAGGNPWPGIPCDGGTCGCGYSADEQVALAARLGIPIMLTLVGTPAWARGPRAEGCSASVPPRALPLRQGKEGAFQTFAAAVARRYGTVAYAFELWNEPDLAGCETWAGTRQQYKEQILSAAAAVKSTGATPGLVVAPTLEEPSGAAMDAWVDWSAPVDRLSFNLYQTSTSRALAKLDEMHAWCRAARRCPGFYVTEFGAQRSGTSRCPGPLTSAPGAADVAVMKRCRQRGSCAGLFLYPISDRSNHPNCDRGLIDVRGCRKRRLCAIAERVFDRRDLPFSCDGCRP